MTAPITLRERLRHLPRKQALAFKQLFNAGQINEEVLADVLDAGELAGNPPTLLGFAVGYLFLRSQAVPVTDVIRMARSQNRRVNLCWSAARWHAEHDRLARAETLMRLAAENMTYDVSRYAAKLPARFTGYLIRSSRRLGMEGLRQRHCVASYHALVQSGACVLCVVFVNQKRWTVQLALASQEDAPLRVVQIRTRFNEFPSREMRLAICRVLGVEETRTEEPHPPREPRNYMEILRTILPVLRTRRVDSVYVSFEGSGDSGSIHDIRFNGANEHVGDEEVEIDRPVLSHQAGRWLTTLIRERSTLKAAVEGLADQYLDEAGVDWYNDDGGYGELVIDVAAGTVALEINCRFTESSTEYSAMRDIMTGEELEV